MSKKYWFKRRRFGWGWTPVTWQGVTVLVVALVAVFVAALQLPAKPKEPTGGQLGLFFIELLGILVLMFIITYVKSPKPHWRWGKKSSDNSDEDF